MCILGGGDVNEDMTLYDIVASLLERVRVHWVVVGIEVWNMIGSSHDALNIQDYISKKTMGTINTHSYHPLQGTLPQH